MTNKSYVICTTPRSGSNLLCGLLSSSKEMGQPNEYLNPSGTLVPLAKDNHVLDPQGRISVEAYLKYVTETSTTPNGCFGLKILFDQLETFGKFQAVRDLFMKCRYIWLVRQDIVAQAVSLYLASETGSWKSFEKEKKPREKLEYSEENIQFYIDRMLKHNLKWEEFFMVNQVDYLRVNYEDILVNTQSVCQTICAFCGVETDHQFLIDKVRFKKQGDSLNELYASRFRKNSALNFSVSSYKSQELCIEGIQVIE